MNATLPICPSPSPFPSLSSTHHRLLPLDMIHPSLSSSLSPIPTLNFISTINMPNYNRHHTTGNNPSPPKPTRRILSIILKFIVMSLILSLFLLFIGLAAIILLHLLLAGSFLHRRRRRFLSRSTTPRDSALSLNDIQNHLPPFQYPAAEQSTSTIAATAGDDCSICLDCFNEGEICRVLPVCDHVFHARCLDRWLTRVPNCPICRTRIRLDAGGASDSVVNDDETKFLWAIGVGR